MIRFNGIALDEIAPVRLIDISIGPMPVRTTARERPIRAGADFVRVAGGTRHVEVMFALLTQDRITRQEQLLAINRWATTTAPGRLVFADHPGRYLNAVCTGYPEPSMRQWWEQNLRVQWTCEDPYWYAMTEKSVSCGTQFKAGGSATPYVRITDTLSATGDRTYSDGTTSMVFTDVPAGDLEIDLERQTAKVGNTSILSGLAFASLFIEPKNTMTITGSGTVHYRERWV